MSTTTDVNAQFAAEKAGQIAGAYARTEAANQRIADYLSGKTQAELDATLAQQVADGKIEMIGADRYKVLTGWDANEIFSVQRATRPGEVPLVLPEHGLDMNEDGTANLYLSSPAWHGLGTVIPGGISNVESVLKLSGLDFEVEQRPVEYHADGELRTVPGSFVNIRTDTNDPLGVVGKIYTPVQNRQGFSFLNELVGNGEAVWESAGPLRGGKRVFISMRLPEDITLDIGGTEDTIRPYVVVINSHDGQTPFMAMVTPWRPVCKNTERFALRDARSRWVVRHTTNALQAIDEARRTLGLSMKYFETFQAEEERLARIGVQIDEVRALVADLWPLEENPSKRAVTTFGNREAAVLAEFGTEAGRSGRTAYAAERAITSYLDHTAPKRELSKGDGLAAARATAIMEDTDGEIKSKAHAKLMALQANRQPR